MSLLVLAGCGGCEDKKTTAPADAAPITQADAAPLNASPLENEKVAKLLNPSGLPAYAGPTGSVEGTITVEGDAPPETPGDFHMCPDGEKTYGRAFRVDGSGRLADAIVAVTGYKGFFVPEKSEAKAIAIEGCAFSARTLTMTFGQRIEVKNLSDKFWSPVMEPAQSSVIMMATPKGDPVRLYPKQPGHFLLVDHDRKYAVTDVYTFLHPLHTASDVQGHYRIDGLPLGKVTINTKHPRFEGEASKELDVKEGVVHKVDLKLRYAGAAKSYDAGAGLPKLR